METHAQDVAFIVWAYAGAAIAVLGLLGATWWSSQRVKARLAALDAQGIRRRSDA